VLLARHGQTDWNATGRFHGRANVGLNETGRRQAEGLAMALADHDIDLIVSSPLDRALDTASAVAAGAARPVVVDQRLIEVHVGEWVGLTEAEVFARDPEFPRARSTGRDYRLSPSGETTSQCGHRVADALREIAGANAGGRVLVVGHGYALQAGLGQVLGWTIEQSGRIDGLFNCGVTELTVQAGQWRLTAHNICDPRIPAQRSGEIKTV
jgi:probable phosphoglycerate mutase